MEKFKQNTFQGTILQYAKVFPIPEKLSKLDLQPGMGMNFMYILEYFLAVLGDARGKDYSEQKNKFLGGHVGTSALDENDWTKLTESGIKTGSISLETIFKKSIKEKGRSLISFNLLGSTKQAVIFIVGKVA